MFTRICFFIVASVCLSSCFFIEGSTTNVPLEYKETYLKHKDAGEQYVSYGYNYLITQLASGLKIHRQFYPEKNQLTQQYGYRQVSRNKILMNGPYFEWWDNGNKKSVGQMLNNEKMGKWEFYDRKTGTKTREDQYVNGEKEGKSIIYYPDGRVKAEYTNKNNLYEGDFVEFDSLGVIVNEGIYRMDTIYKQTRVVEIREYGEESMPRFPGCEDLTIEDERNICAQGKMLEFVYGNLKYPLTARKYGVGGEVISQFVVSKDGTIKDIEIIQGICGPMEAAVRSVLEKMPVWKPGEQDGKKVNVKFTLPVKFRIEG